MRGIKGWEVDRGGSVEVCSIYNGGFNIAQFAHCLFCASVDGVMFSFPPL